jgi:hypothetical protein
MTFGLLVGITHMRSGIVGHTNNLERWMA